MSLANVKFSDPEKAPLSDLSQGLPDHTYRPVTQLIYENFSIELSSLTTQKQRPP